jgi:hypothetical protein
VLLGLRRRKAGRLAPRARGSRGAKYGHRQQRDETVHHTFSIPSGMLTP